MDNYTGTISPPGMYVRALYDYDAHDRTSLSFQQGDIIQVLTQLESGWWDGIAHEKRGWFPSNYCTIISADEARDFEEGGDFDAGRGDLDETSDGDFEDYGFQSGLQGHLQRQLPRAQHAIPQSDQEEAEFWIPQATPDGRLFYFNTLTGVTTMELPLESPGLSDTRKSRTFFVDDQNRPVHAFSDARSDQEDTDGNISTSETEEMATPRKSGVWSRTVSHNKLS